MKTLGRRSVSSVLTVLLNAGFYGIILVLALAIVFLLTGSPVAVWIGPDGSVSIEGPGPAVGMAIPVAFALDAQMHRAEARSLGINTAEIRDIRGSLRFPPRPGPLTIANWMLVISLLTLALWVLSQFRALFRTLREGQPFLPANAARVYRIGWAVILGEIARSAIVYFEERYAMTHFSVEGIRLNAHLNVNFETIVTGFMILVLAEILRLGSRLDEEQSLTI